MISTVSSRVQQTHPKVLKNKWNPEFLGFILKGYFSNNKAAESSAISNTQTNTNAILQRNREKDKLTHRNT
jgi:hypothetical protein